MERIHSLYLHVPFCTWVCKYCDFNAYAVLEGLIPPYVDALSREIEVAGAELPIGPLETVFIGGGTPSLLTRAQVTQVLDPVRAIGLAPGAEVTLEANPSNVSAEHVEGWLAAGVNRLSMGVQSLQPDALRFLERLHSGPDAIAAIRTARTGGFANISADLLFGVPGVNLAGWLATLESVLAEGVQHLSAYELTVESATRLGQEVRTGLVRMPGEDDQLEQYWAAAARLEAAGYAHYEISNWAQPGFSCRHNLAAWNYQPYLGCGAGAHSMFRQDNGCTERRWNLKGPHKYIREMSQTGHATEGGETLSPERARGEGAMIGIRVLQGTIAAREFPAQRQQLVGAGLLVERDGQVRLTRRGVELANQVGAAFLS
ncbi:MAG TPA: radical SAM family heme chaperone HemW [Candidatus Dormibacteraeota bacterium]|jgi:oxygen-independent coproporphyrinogen-3 oxidase|nr:radical SAM family heme chaperone HemW [Candidatus Dormibacteraeota bacterium]